MFIKCVYNCFLVVLHLLQATLLNTSEVIAENSDKTSPVKCIADTGFSIQDTISGQELQIDNVGSQILQMPFFLSAKSSGGMVLGKIHKLNISRAEYYELKAGISSLGNRWEDVVYGMPYYGIGVGFYNLNSDYTGHPISIYMFQGGTLKTFSKRIYLRYEWNFGTSFNWKRYNPVTNPDNIYIGAPINIYFAANMYLMFVLSKDMDLNAGFTFNHVSNGATRMPNSGINMLASFAGLTYYFGRDRIIHEFNPSLRAPVFKKKRLISDISVHSTVRQRTFSTKSTGLSSKYLDKNFLVMEASYALLYMPDYNRRYGAGLDVVYDESAGFTVRKVGEKTDGGDLVESSHGCFAGRLALGLSCRGDIVQPKFSVSAQLGYEVLNGNKQDARFYQTFSVRVPLWEGFYGAFILRAQNLSKAQYMFLGVGYMINHKVL